MFNIGIWLFKNNKLEWESLPLLKDITTDLIQSLEEFFKAYN